MRDKDPNIDEEPSRLREFIHKRRIAIGAGVLLLSGLVVAGYVASVESTVERNKDFDIGQVTEGIFDTLKEQEGTPVTAED